jgi:DNA primase
MVNDLLINKFNLVLGQGKSTSRGNYSYRCPFCNHHKNKFEICFDENSNHFQKYACWVCGVKGSSLTKLSRLLKKDESFQNEVKSLTPKSRIIFREENKNEISLPKEFIPLHKPSKSIIYRHAVVYLRKRGVSIEDIIKYNLGYCEEGEYSNTIIIPSYDNKGTLNYFIGKEFMNDGKRYKLPKYSRDIIPFEFYINWNQPIILCEGPFDALSIKRNAIPLLGKNIQTKLMSKLMESNIKKIYIALDRDAIKSSLKFCEDLMNEGKQIHFINLDKKDPNELGFQKFTQLLHNSKPLTFSNLLEKKLTLL